MSSVAIIKHFEKNDLPFWQMSPGEVFDERYKLIKKAGKDKGMQEKIIQACQQDPVLFINWFVITYDPRNKQMPYLPFSLVPIQEEYIRWRRRMRSLRKNGLVEKSRDSGISWANCADQFIAWLFEWGYAGSFGSMKETLVDRRGDPKSLFEKLRIIYRNLPYWLQPPGFEPRYHDSYMKLINPFNGSVITGEVGRNMGRGGRSTVYDWDETAFAEHPEDADAALSGNTDVIIYTSTVNGHNFFYQKRCLLAETDPECIFRFHWKDDPRKTETWYKDMCNKYDAVLVASECDIDYGASVSGIFIPNAWVMAAVSINLPFVSEPIVASLDVAGEGKNLNVIIFRQGSKIIHIEHWSGLHTTQTAYKAVDIMSRHNVKVFNFDADGIGEGVASTLALMSNLPFRVNALKGAKPASNTWWEGERRTSKDKFANARAEWWALLKERFKRTYDYLQGASPYSPEEMLDIPNHGTLIQQLSQPIGKWNQSGKILLESKEDMKERGIGSPDFADALAYSFAPSTGF
jgi:hypothetical protein